MEEDHQRETEMAKNIIIISYTYIQRRERSVCLANIDACQAGALTFTSFYLMPVMQAPLVINSALDE